MTDAQRTLLRALLARGLLFPEARELALLLLSIAQRRNGYTNAK
jgi:hypothetical protein